VKLLRRIDDGAPRLLDLEIRIRYGEVAGRIRIERQLWFPVRFEEVDDLFRVAGYDLRQF
jgi:hypothetical protein